MTKCNLCDAELTKSYFIRVKDHENLDTKYSGYIVEVCPDCYTKQKKKGGNSYGR